MELNIWGMVGFVFGLIAFLRVQKLISKLKEKGILEENYKED
tara:strand:- start:587 stop:712 length:126 start_codon:yes stop_codon:yes gene_type:complete